MNAEAEKIIKHLKLISHPEGGYYREIYRSPLIVKSKRYPNLDENRNLFTSIYFLLNEIQVSAFHQLASDEIWYFHSGCAVKIFMIEKSGKLTIHELGTRINQNPQVCIPAGTIFGSELVDKKSYALIGCMVSPGFDFSDFKLISRHELVDKYAQHTQIIYNLTQK